MLRYKFKKKKIEYDPIEGVETYEAESREQMLRRYKEEGISTENVSPLNYTEKKDGVLPGYNIRTDKFEVMREATEKLGQSIEYIASMNEKEDKATEVANRKNKKEESNADSAVAGQ